MIHNFENWRQAKMRATAIGCRSMHYFRIDDDVVDTLTTFFRSILILRVDHGFHGRVSFAINDSLAQVMLDFCEQSTYGYIHPRSTSARMRFVAQNRLANPLRYNPKS